MSTANERQVGGDHYSSTYQHWDFVEDSGLGYLEGCATKYLMPTRRARKGGTQDLEKALHYVDKLIERATYHGRQNRGCSIERVARLARANGLGELEEAAVLLIAMWRTRGDLMAARQAVETVIKKAQQDAN